MSGRGRTLRPGGVVRALLRFFLLVVLGFAAGLVIGVVSEEPELLAGHLRGESNSVSLFAEANGSSAADGAITADGSSAADGVVKQRSGGSEAAGRGEAKAPEVSAPRQVRKQVPAPREAFAIQVGAFSDERAAQELSRGLSQKGYSTSILPSSGSTRRWRVRVQPLADEATAEAMAGRLKLNEGLPTWVLRMEPETDAGRGTR